MVVIMKGLLLVTLQVIFYSLILQVESNVIKQPPRERDMIRLQEGKAKATELLHSLKKRDLTALEEAKIAAAELLIEKYYALESCAADIGDKLDWELYKLENSRNYNDAADDVRYKEYKKTNDLIEEHNKRYEEGLESYQLGYNEYADWTDEEMEELKGFKSSGPQNPNDIWAPPGMLRMDVPAYVNWTDKGAVTPIESQLKCGSCWTYSAAGAVEGAIFKATNVLPPPLSKQQLVDCSLQNNGCDGGDPGDALRYVLTNGLQSQADYPYINTRGTCTYNALKAKYKISKIKEVQEGNEQDLKVALATYGPIAISMDCKSDLFDNYDGTGVFNPPESQCKNLRTQLNHAMVLTGYGTTEKGEDYWLIKNSWGTTWGDNGYMKLARNKDNKCGIASEAVFAIVETQPPSSYYQYNKYNNYNNYKNQG